MKRKLMGMIIVIIFLLGVGCTPKKNVVDNQNNNEIKDNVSKEENEFQSKIILFEGQTIYVDNYLSISFKESFFMDRVEPENPIGYYENSIVPKDKNNRFLVLKTVIKNLKEEKLTGEEIPSSTMIFDDQYKYETTIISEEKDGSKLNNQSDLMEIPPLLTKNIWYLVEIPEDISPESNFVMEYQIKNQSYHVQLSKPIDLKNDPVPNVKQKINAYMFWRDGCPHCENAHSFFKTIAKKYESCYQLVDFEVWTNDKHVPLQKKVSKYFKANELGVPLIVIGDKHFAGYAESFNEEIIQALIEGCTSDNYVDIVSKIQNNK